MTRPLNDLLRDVATALTCYASTKHAQAHYQKNPAIKAEMLLEVDRIEVLEREVRAAAQAQAQTDEQVHELARIADGNRQRYELAEAAHGGAVNLARTLQSALAADAACAAILADPRWDGGEQDRAEVFEEQRRLQNLADLWFRSLRDRARRSDIPGWDGELRAQAQAGAGGGADGAVGT